MAEEKKRKYQFGCLMLDLNIPKWEALKNFIGEENLYTTSGGGFGFESEPHVTVLFGFHDSDEVVNKIRTKLAGMKGNIEVELKNISLFENCLNKQNGQHFDVVKFEIVSQDLKDLNSYFRDNFEHTNDHPEYNPHMTIAYVKAGLGKKFSAKFKKKVTYMSNNFVYSRPEKEKERFTIKK